MTKKEIVNELNELGVDFDLSLNKEELKALLEQAKRKAGGEQAPPPLQDETKQTPPPPLQDETEQAPAISLAEPKGTIKYLEKIKRRQETIETVLEEGEQFRKKLVQQYDLLKDTDRNLARKLRNLAHTMTLAMKQMGRQR